MNKTFYNENGQLTPFMLAIIVILIMAVMVTINIGKVSLTKTQTANTADAGSLAGASAMANVFNMIADANDEMQDRYWIFFATVTAMFVWATIELGSIHALTTGAMASACLSPCTAKEIAEAAADKLGNLYSGFIGKINAISFEVIAFWLTQWNFYEQMRDAALDGHNSAVRLAFQLAFSNSGISQKLIPGSAPSDPAQLKGNANNYQSSFSDFMDRIWVSGNPTVSRQIYPWLDGQNRNHRVEVDVALAPPEKYEARVTVAPYFVEMATLLGIKVLAYAAKTNIRLAEIALDRACTGKRCCRRRRPSCCALWLSMCAAAMGMLSIATGEIIAIYPLLGIAEGGLVSGRTSWKDDVRVLTERDILCWIEEVGSSREEPHNGQVRVGTVQAHQGADLGVWQTQYPNVNSFSVANFRLPGRGQINPPEPRHDASIVQTD